MSGQSHVPLSVRTMYVPVPVQLGTSQVCGKTRQMLSACSLARAMPRVTRVDGCAGALDSVLAMKFALRGPGVGVLRSTAGAISFINTCSISYFVDYCQ